MIVAFGHKKGVGKNTAAKFLNTYLRCETSFCTQQASFADKLKEIAYQLYSWSGLKPGIFYETHRYKKEVKLPKLDLSPREIWIQIGNKLREIYPATWINYLIKNNKSNQILIISDLRFINEAKAIQDTGGLLIKINRDVPRGFDSAEIDLDNWTNWNLIIDNNGTFEDLNKKVIELIVPLIIKKE